MRVDYGHSEVISQFGRDPREYNISTKRFVVAEDGKLEGLETVRVDWTEKSGRWSMEERPGSKEFWPADMVFLALGFLGPEQGLLKSMDIKVDGRSNIQTPLNVSNWPCTTTIF